MTINDSLLDQALLPFFDHPKKAFRLQTFIRIANLQDEQAIAIQQMIERRSKAATDENAKKRLEKFRDFFSLARAI